MAMTTLARIALDEQIRRQVLADLAWDPRGASPEMAGAGRGGVVTLGAVGESHRKRWLAPRRQPQIQPVPVENRISVASV